MMFVVSWSQKELGLYLDLIVLTTELWITFIMTELENLLNNLNVIGLDDLEKFIRITI